VEGLVDTAYTDKLAVELGCSAAVDLEARISINEEPVPA